VYPVISTLKKPELIFIDVLYLNLLSPTSVKFRTTRQECWHADVGQLCEERIDSIGIVNVKPNLADFVVAHVHNHRSVPTFVNFQYFTPLTPVPCRLSLLKKTGQAESLPCSLYLPGGEKATSRTSWPVCTSHKRGVQARAIEDVI
jgi:hypothetical protein